jgi:protein gp37
VIVGGESGNDNGEYRYRPCELSLIESFVEQCKKQNVPVFVKQMGTYLSKELKMKDRHGGDIEEFPKHLQIREFPKTK